MLEHVNETLVTVVTVVVGYWTLESGKTIIKKVFFRNSKTGLVVFHDGRVTTDYELVHGEVVFNFETRPTDVAHTLREGELRRIPYVRSRNIPEGLRLARARQGTPVEPSVDELNQLLTDVVAERENREHDEMMGQSTKWGQFFAEMDRLEKETAEREKIPTRFNRRPI